MIYHPSNKLVSKTITVDIMMFALKMVINITQFQLKSDGNYDVQALKMQIGIQLLPLVEIKMKDVSIRSR